MQRRSGRTRQPLVSGKTINYFTSRLHTDIDSKFVPTAEQKSTILDLWQHYTPQGKKATLNDKQRFLTSGDIDLLSRALARGKNDYTVLLSNNYSEVGKVAEQLNQQGYHVNVLTARDIFGSSGSRH